VADENVSGFISFAKSTLVFFIGNTLSKIITIALLPLYTNALPSDDYGYFDVSVTLVTLLTSFLYCDIWASVMRFMRDDLKGEAPKVVTASGWVVFGGSTIFYYLLGVLAWLFFEIPSLGYILLYGTAMNLQTMFSYIARGWGDNVRFAISGIINAVVNVTLSIVLILVLGWGYEALYFAFVFGSATQCTYLFLALRMWRRIARPKAAQVRELFMYSAPLCLNSVAYWLLNSLGRVVVSVVLSFHASGIFAVASKFGSAINLATTCFTYAWQDISFTSNIRSVSFYSRATTQYVAFLMDSLALLLPFVALLFPVLVGSGYEEAYNVIPSFLVVAIVSAISTFIGNIFYVIKDTKTIGKTMAISCLVNVLFTYPLTMTLGLNGTNAAIVIAFVANIAIRLKILRNRLGMRLSLSVVLPRVVLVLLSGVVYMFNSSYVSGVFFICLLVLMIFLYRRRIAGIIKSISLKEKR